MLEQVKSALKDYPRDGAIYLICKLSDTSGFFVSQKHLVYMVHNIEETSHQSLVTEFLRLNTNIEIIAIKNDQEFKSGRYNIIEILPVDGVYENANLESFINLCVAHTKFMRASNFVKFFYSLVDLFQIPKEQKRANLVGLFGELCFLDYASQTRDIDFSDKWHVSGSRDKYDISLNSCNIEIKTTTSVDELVTVKHSQLFNGKKNFLVAVMLEECNGGRSLNELLTHLQLHPTHFKSFNFALNIERERKRVSSTDAESRKFELKAIRIYDAQKINPFQSIPKNVSNMVYSLDLEDIPTTTLIDVIKIKDRNV